MWFQVKGGAAHLSFSSLSEGRRYIAPGYECVALYDCGISSCVSEDMFRLHAYVSHCDGIKYQSSKLT